MPLLSRPLIRRYAAPTCSLEVKLPLALLSRWSQAATDPTLQFQLCLVLPDQDQPLTIAGDRAQLEALAIAVTTYIQQLLRQEADALALEINLSRLDLPALPPGRPESEGLMLMEPEPIGGERGELEPIGGEIDELESECVVAVAPAPEGLALQFRPRNLLWHDLDLGDLAAPAAPAATVVRLSTTQLLDLETVLEMGLAETKALPSRPQQLQRWVQTTPIWARSAAIVVMLVGVTSGGLSFSDRLTPRLNPVTLSQNPQLPKAAPAAPLVEPPPPPPGATVIPPPALTLTPADPTPNPNLPLPSPPPTATANLPPAAPDPTATANPLTVEPVPLPEIPVSQLPLPAPVVPVEPETAAEPPALPELDDRAAPLPELRSETTTTGNNFASSRERDSLSGTVAKRSDLAPIPQVQEIQAYFADRWQPPATLKQPLEYTLVLNPDGSILRVVPQGKAAGLYLDRTPIPLANEPFVSPLAGQSNARIRLILSPNGQVQSFLEASN